MNPRLLLLLPTAGYRNHDFVAAADRLGIEIVAAADHCHRLAPAWGLPPVMALHFDQPDDAADTVLRETGGVFDAVLAVDDAGLALAALLNQRLGLQGNATEAVDRVRDKLAFRQLLRAQGLPCPDFQHLPSGADARSLLPALALSRGRQGAAAGRQPRRDPRRRRSRRCCAPCSACAPSRPAPTAMPTRSVSSSSASSLAASSRSRAASAAAN